jgi:stress-induced-phosphoprotein 1
MSTQKELGTKAFQEKDFNKAVSHFTKAIEETPNDHTLYSNRSACYYNLNQFTKALEDGEMCIKIKPDWDKSYQRRGMALHAMGMYD